MIPLGGRWFSGIRPAGESGSLRRIVLPPAKVPEQDTLQLGLVAGAAQLTDRLG